jgi:hypothetical protein
MQKNIIFQQKIKLTERQSKDAVDYSNKKSNNAREKFSELIGKKGEFVAYNFLKEKLNVDRIQGPDLEVFSRKEKRDLKENNIMLSDNDLFINDKFKIQVKSRYVGKNAKFINSLDNIKEDPIFFTIKDKDVIFTNNDCHVFFVLVSNEAEGLVTAVLPSTECVDLIGRVTDQGLQLHVPKFKYKLDFLK